VVNVVLIGHSYIRRLGEYMETSPELRNLGFSDINVHCVGVGGANAWATPLHKEPSSRSITTAAFFNFFTYWGE